MKHSVIVMAAFVGFSLLGCGGPTVESEELGEVSQELTTCSATCSGGQTVSCTGTTCSATQYSGVTCDGVFTPCPSTYPPPPTCDHAPVSCYDIQGDKCFGSGTSSRRNCCDGEYNSWCVCSSGRYVCA